MVLQELLVGSSTTNVAMPVPRKKRFVVDWLVHPTCALSCIEAQREFYMGARVSRELAFLNVEPEWVMESGKLELWTRQEDDGMWAVAWRDELISSVLLEQDLYLIFDRGPGMLVTWLQAMKEEAADAAALDERSLLAKLAKPVSDVITLLDDDEDVDPAFADVFSDDGLDLGLERPTGCNSISLYFSESEPPRTEGFVLSTCACAQVLWLHVCRRG